MMRKYGVYFAFVVLGSGLLLGCDSSSSSMNKGSTIGDPGVVEPHPSTRFKFAPSAATSLDTLAHSSTPLTANRNNFISLGLYESNNEGYQLITEPGQIHIHSQCAAQGQASLTSSLDEMQDGSIRSPLILGRFQFHYEPSFNCVEDKLSLRFSSTRSNQTIAESMTFTVEAPQPSSINFVGFSHGSLLRKVGTANPLLPEQTTATFVVIDSNGTPVGPGREVGFTLINDTVTTSAPRMINQRNFTNADGEVTVAVAAGSDAVSFYIGVDIVGTAQTQIYSPQLTVTSGFPARMNVFRDEADIDMDFVSYQLSVLLADRNGNPVPVGTIVRFEAPSSGVIDAICETNERSQCSVTWSGNNNTLPTSIIAKTQREPGLSPLEVRGNLPKVEEDE